MAISAPAHPLRTRPVPRVPSSRIAPWLLTPVVLFVDGYHPFAGDAGIYAAGIRHILDPALYPLNSVFVAAFTRRSVFAWTAAALVRITHAPLAWILLPLHLLSIALFLAACRSVAARLFATEAARWCAVLLAAACCSLPVAGTALVLMDPYLTARSFSTPLGLLAVAACLDRAWMRTAIFLGLAALLHPLMGCYAIVFVLLLALISNGRTGAAAAVCAAGVALAGIACALGRRLPDSSAYREAIDLPQRTFLFLARWQWYEILGLILPLALYGVALRRLTQTSPAAALCRATILLGSTSLLVAAVFVRPTGPWLLIPLQPLRAFHIIYSVGVILCGGMLGLRFARHRLAAALLVLMIFAGMACAETAAWPACNRIEWPGVRPGNRYQQAFLWIRSHTPRDAVFAFDPQFVYRPGEDEQGFRALAERGHLGDDKDAGIVAVIPGLASRWAAQRNLTSGINTMSDAQRRGALVPFGVNWILLPASAQTALQCPFRNETVQVCQLTQP